MKPAIFEMSPDTRLIRQRLFATKIGDFVSYFELSQIISKPVAGGSSWLQSAVNSLLRHDQLRFSCVRGEGLKRLSDTEIVAASDVDIDAVRRKARKAAIKMTAIQNFAGMTPRDQLAHTTRLSIFTALASISSDSGIKKIEAIATGRSTELPIAETLLAFISPATGG